MLISIQQYQQYCGRNPPCGQVIQDLGAKSLVSRFMIVSNGKRLVGFDTREDAVKFVIRKGWTLAPS